MGLLQEFPELLKYNAQEHSTAFLPPEPYCVNGTYTDDHNYATVRFAYDVQLSVFFLLCTVGFQMELWDLRPLQLLIKVHTFALISQFLWFSLVVIKVCLV